MERKEPILFKKHPNLKDNVPWIPILTQVPTSVDRLSALETDLAMGPEGRIYIKRDDKNHDLYGGNKLRKFEFIFADALEKNKNAIMTFGGVGTNHGLACAIVAKQLGLRCDLFLAEQPLTWHVQRSLLLFDHFDAKMHYSKGYGALALKGLFFRLFHPKHYIMLPGGSMLLGKGTPLGTIGFINAAYELEEQIVEGKLMKPDVIYVAGGSTGTAAGLISGIKALDLEIDVHVVAVSDEMFVNYNSITKNCNKALEYLQERDPEFPKIRVNQSDFKIISGYLGSEYGVKTTRGQKAVDKVMRLEGKEAGFKLETTYTGKAMAGMLDFLELDENKIKKILFWNTYNSNDLDDVLRTTNFNYKKLPKKLQSYYKRKLQCWQLANCPKDIRESCLAYLNHEYRFWKVTDCNLEDSVKNKIKSSLEQALELEDA